MGRTIVHDPKHSSGRAIRLLVHDLGDQSIKGSNPALGFTATIEFGPMDIPSGQISPSSLPLVLMFDLHRQPWLGRHRFMEPTAGLDAGLLVGREHEFIGVQLLSLPLMLIQIEDPTRLEGESRVARKNPTAVLPRTNRILVEPSPEC